MGRGGGVGYHCHYSQIGVFKSVYTTATSPASGAQDVICRVKSDEGKSKHVNSGSTKWFWLSIIIAQFAVDGKRHSNVAAAERV